MPRRRAIITWPEGGSLASGGRFYDQIILESPQGAYAPKGTPIPAPPAASTAPSTVPSTAPSTGTGLRNPVPIRLRGIVVERGTRTPVPNAAVIALLAKALGRPRSGIRLARGATARVKQIDVGDVSQAEAAAAFGTPL